MGPEYEVILLRAYLAALQMTRIINKSVVSRIDNELSIHREAKITLTIASRL